MFPSLGSMQLFLFFFFSFTKVRAPSADISPLHQRCPPSKATQLKAMTQNLQREDDILLVRLCVCFLYLSVCVCKVAYVHCGKKPWVSWLHISRINELIWTTKSLQRGGHVSSLFLCIFSKRRCLSWNFNVKLVIKRLGDV